MKPPKALAGAGVVVDVTNSPSFPDAAVLEFFETSTRNLLAAEVVVGAPVNGIVELAGPEALPIAEFVGRFLAASGDTRTVVADPRARYFGAALDDRGLNPGDDPRVGPTRFKDWLGRSVSQG